MQNHRPLNPKNYLIAIVVFFLFAMALAFAPVYVQVKFRIASHRQPVIKITETEKETIIEDKEVIYYHKGRR